MGFAQCEIFACGKCEMWPTGHVIYTVLRTGYLPEANMETLYRVYCLFNGEQYCNASLLEEKENEYYDP